MIYLFDTNSLSDLLERRPTVVHQVAVQLAQNQSLAICRPVHYEVLRGLFWRKASSKLRLFNQRVLPVFSWLTLEDADWEQAANFWADARRRGKQLSDTDLLLAALAYRTGATVVSNDADFDALPITRENWRNSP